MTLQEISKLTMSEIADLLHTRVHPMFYTPQDLANRWKVTKRTVLRWISTGAINALDTGHELRVREEEVQRVEDLMEKGRFQ